MRYRLIAAAAVVVVVVFSLSLLVFAQEAATQPAGSVPLTIIGGHELNPEDRGRPVILIAAALGVPEQVFRDVFKGVRPSRDGKPSGEEARANKKVLLDGLAKYGVTNERLDEVSNYYRYKPQDGGLWRHAPAAGFATVKDGVVTSVTITDAGRGYSSQPAVSVEGATTPLKASIAFGKDLATNGSVQGVEIIEITE
ncbi:MAG TPA: hypothetical protein VGN72_07325 [Tepidisphaeraceae bacterium]|jgi:hypothetical protein|nr:hypothetical protein [Tepidisphaeraceae bacterium]